MPWVRLDDMFSDHPKVLSVGPLAECLFVRGLTYAARYLTDGFVPINHLRRMADMDAVSEAEKLLAAGLWEPAADGYQIHDYLDYQPSAEKVKAERAANAKRQAEWRDRHHNDVSNSVTNAARNAPVTPAPYPSLTRPNEDGTPLVVPPAEDDGADAPPDQTEESSERRGKEPPVRAVPKPTKRSVPADFAVTEEMIEQARDWGMTFEDIAFETDKFLDNFRASGERKVDWVAAWRNWMRRRDDFAPKGRARARSPNGLAPGVIANPEDYGGDAYLDTAGKHRKAG